MNYSRLVSRNGRRVALAVAASAWVFADPSAAQVTPQSSQAPLKAREVRLGKLPVMPTLSDAVVSADCLHVAFPCKHGAQSSVFYDGQEGQNYQRVHSLSFSASGAHFAYVGVETPSNAVLVLDGRDGPAYQGIAPESFKFSPDGQRHAFVVGLPFTNALRVAGKLWAPSRVVVDGKESRDYHYIATRSLAFSPDSKHLAYHASLSPVPTEKNLSVVVRDGVESPPYEEILQGTPVFSPDSQHLAFGSQRDGKKFAVLDGNERGPYDEIGGVMFTPDSKKLVYHAKRGDRWFLVSDEKETGLAEEGLPGGAVFSPDSQRMAVFVEKGRRHCWLVDGKPGPEFDGVFGLTFSPDSQRFIYTGKRASQFSVVIDDVESRAYEGVVNSLVHFSPDSRHVAFLAKRDQMYRLVLDGKEGAEYDWPGQRIAFSPDSQHVAFLAGRGRVSSPDQQPDRVFVVVDGRESGAYAGILPSLVFVGNNTVRVIAVRLNDLTMQLELARVELDVSGK